MPVYTGKGDEGDTSGADGVPVRKTDLRVKALGGVDELNAHIGLCVQAASAGPLPDVAGPLADIVEALETVQRELFVMGAMLAVLTPGREAKVALDGAAVDRMERQIDQAWAKAGDLTHFILPGGCELACRLHVARTVCRRAERGVVVAADAGNAIPAVVLKHLNRLSDLLFALARLANHEAGQTEKQWP